MPASHWCAGSIARVAQIGIMTGYPDGTFRPEQPITRAEIASVLHRLTFRDGLFADILPAVMPSVVEVNRGDALGSGFCIAEKDGFSFILTNKHVVGDKTGFTIIRTGQPDVKATLATICGYSDLALVKAPLSLPVLEFAPGLELGEAVAVIGAPYGFAESVTVGVVSNLNRDGMIQVDAPINPGNSGGPIINERGEVVGVVVSKVVDLAAEALGFAIQKETAEKYVKQVLG